MDHLVSSAQDGVNNGQLAGYRQQITETPSLGEQHGGFINTTPHMSEEKQKKE